MSLTGHANHVNWTPDEAESTCGDLIQALMNLLPEMSLERAGAEDDDGLIFFTNSQGSRVKVKISREALQDYLEADDHNQRRKEQQLARCMERIDSDNLVEALITSDHLAP